MSDIFEKIAALRAKYPEDTERIDKDQEALVALLQKKDFAELEATKQFVATCRKHVVAARMKLATDRSLLGNDEAQRELWYIIDARVWVIGMLAADYEMQLEQIESDLDAELNA
jgi:hypothetical protein